VSAEQVLYTPSAVQREAHNCRAREILYGGTQNCGKTWWLRWDPIMTQVYDWLGSPGEHSRYLEALKRGEKWKSKGWALHLRRTFPMLLQTISKVLDFVYKVDPGAVYNPKNYMITFTCGYKWQFGHCQKDDDWRQYDSSEYCVEETTEVLMASGEYRQIRHIREGEFVTTLEGPRRVIYVHRTGNRPCVEVSFPLPDGSIGRQIHPTTHPVLVSSRYQSPYVQSPDEPPAGSRSLLTELSWLDYESALCGHSECRAKRVSSIDRERGFAKSDGSHLGFSQLPVLSFPLALHEPSYLSDGTLRERPIESHEFLALPGGSTGSLQAGQMLEASIRERLALVGIAYESIPRNTLDILSCGTSCDLIGSEIARDSTGRCSACSRLRDAPSLISQDSDLLQLQQPDDAGNSSPIGSHRDALGNIHSDMVHRRPSYQHFYLHHTRQATEDVRIVEAKVQFHGWAETCDLTVEDVNHYITRFGVVNTNCHISFDESVQFTKEQFDRITARLRSEDHVLEAKRRICLATNPDAPAEGVWVKERYVDPCPSGRKLLSETVTMFDGTQETRTRIFIPAFLTDNPNKTLARETEIDLRTKPRHIVEARLFGNWDVVENAFFSSLWRKDAHIVKPFTCKHGKSTCEECRMANGIPKDWPRARAMDWGYKRACVVYYYAKNPDDDIVVYRELTFNHNVPDRERKDAQMVALAIKKCEKEHGEWDEKRNCSKLSGPADYQISVNQGGVGPTIEQTMAKEGVYWSKSVKNRAQAVQELIRRLSDVPTRVGASPAFRAFDTCHHLQRIMPLIIADPSDPELPLKDGNGHWLETIMYMVMDALPAADKARVPRSDDDDEDELAAARNRRQGKWGYGS